MSSPGARRCLHYVGLVTILCVGSLGTGSVCAEEIGKALDAARGQYDRQEFFAAAESIEHARRMVHARLANSIRAVFPAPRAGWVVRTGRNGMGAVAAPGGTETEAPEYRYVREYRKDSSSVQVSVLADPGQLTLILGTYLNPMTVAARGGSRRLVRDRNAIVIYDASGMRGEVGVPVSGRFLVTVLGEGIPRDELMAYAEAVDYDRLDRLR